MQLHVLCIMNGVVLMGRYLLMMIILNFIRRCLSNLCTYRIVDKTPPTIGTIIILQSLHITIIAITLSMDYIYRKGTKCAYLIGILYLGNAYVQPR